jgi:transcriptional regulator with XRE-family HTH domain
VYQLNNILRQRRKELKLTPEEIADKIGKKLRTYQYYEQKENPTIPDPETMQKLAKILQFSIADAYKDASAVQLNNNKKEEATAEQPQQKEETKEDQSLLAKSLLNLTETNKLLAESHKIIAESNKTLADNNKDLIEMHKATVSAPARTDLAFESRFSDLLELISEVAAGETRFESKSEGLASLSKRFHGKPLIHS